MDSPWRWCLLCRKRNQEGDTSCCYCGAHKDYLVNYPVGEGATVRTPDREGVDAICFFCEKRFTDKGLDPDDYYCYGCHEYVCDACELNAALCGPHDVMDHAEETEPSASPTWRS